MQLGGTLKKRRRRNLAKVTGLSTVQYNELEDTFDGKAVFASNTNDNITYHTSRGIPETKLRISALLHQNNGRNHSSNFRVTRDPTFHMEPEDSFEEENTEYDAERVSHAEAGGVESRPYFLDKWTIARIRQIILLGAFSGTFPWRWNATKHRIDKWSPYWEQAWNIQWLVLTVHTSFLSIFQFYVIFHAITAEQHTTYRGLFASSVSVFWYVFAAGFNINMYLYKDQIREYINTLFKFNFEFMKKYVVDLDGYSDGGRIVINFSILSNTCQVFISVCLFVFFPFQPFYMFSYIYPKPWYWLIPWAIQQFVVVGQVITNYILYQWIVVAHTNSMEFWLRESHRNNGSGYTIDELRHPKTAMETYRILQIVSTYFNDCMAPMAFPLMKLHIFGAMIPCGYVFIRSLNHYFIEEFPGILTYPFGIIDCATTGFCTLSLAATVFDLASGFVDSWSKTKHKSFRRILMSCPTLKVKVARFYFVTVATTITFFKVTVDYIIDCIITFP